MRYSIKLATLIIAAVSMSAFAQESNPQASGTWTKKSQPISGAWSITQTDEGVVLTLDDEFKTKKAPDLKLFLSEQELPVLTSKNATQDAILIAPLKSHQGAQSYLLADDIDWKKVKSLLIHCEKYAKLWGGASLQ